MKAQILDHEQLLAHLVEEALLLAEAFACCDPPASVPGLRWDAQTVLGHTGSVHRWAANVVSHNLGAAEAGSSKTFAPSVKDAARLGAWFQEGANILISTLRDAPTSLECFTFIPNVVPRTFWIRRQAHETTIHRADLQAAAGLPVTSVDASFAQDGLSEIVGSFATEPAFASDHAGRLLFEASDGPAWLVTFGSEHNLVQSGDLRGTNVDAVISGSSDQLYRWAWNRPVPIAPTGDPEVIAAWRAIRVE